MAEGVATNNQRGQRSEPCRLWGGLDKARHIVPTALLVRVQCFQVSLNSGFRWEVENVSANQRLGRPSCFSYWPRKHKLGRSCCLASCQVSLNSVQRFQRSRKCFSQSEARATILFFSNMLQKRKLVEGIEIFLTVKFRLNSVQWFWREVENLSANHRPGGHLVFRIGPTNTLGRGVRTLRSCFLSSFVEFRSVVSVERSKMSQLIRDQDSRLVFPIVPKTQTWYRRLRSCFLSRFVEFRSAVKEEKSKMFQPIWGSGGLPLSVYRVFKLNYE